MKKGLSIPPWKSWMLFTRLFISLLLLFVPLHISLGCADDFEDPDQEYYSYLRPEALRLPDFGPYFFSYHDSYGYPTPWDAEQGSYDLEKAENIKDWQRYFGNKISTDALKYTVYHAQISTLQQLEKYVWGDKTAMDSALESVRENQVIKYIIAQKDLAVLHYLLLAKKSALLANKNGDWDYYSPPYPVTDSSAPGRQDWATYLKNDTSQVAALTTEALQAYDKTTSPFLKMRYGYQLVKLAYYNSRQAETTVKYYDTKVKPLKDPSPLRYWALCYKAGVEEDYTRAAYEYMQVFRNCTGKREVAFRSFSLADDSELDSVLSYCKNAEEKVTVLFLTSLDPSAFMLDNMKKMYHAAPNSDELDVLMMREVNKMEDALSTYNYAEGNGYRAYLEDNKGLDEYQAYLTDELIPFADKLAAEKNLRRRDFWLFCSAYLHYLAGQYDTAMSTLLQYEQLPQKNSGLNTSDSVLHATLIADTAVHMTNKLEGIMLPYLQYMADSLPDRVRGDGFNIVTTRLATLYAKAGQPEKGWLLTNRDIDYEKMRKGELAARLHFMQKKDKTPFESFLASIQNYNLDQLYDGLGSEALMIGQLEKSKAWFDKMGGNLEHSELPANPFIIHIRDCHDCDYENPDTMSFTKAGFIDSMVRLKTMAGMAKGREEQARYYFLLGNGYYNMSSYGNSWQVNAYYFSYMPDISYSGYYYDENYSFTPVRTVKLQDSVKALVFPHYGVRVGMSIYGDGEESQFPGSQLDSTHPNMCILAENAYVKAAKTTHAKEFAAQCYWMAAKCALARHYTEEMYNGHYGFDYGAPLYDNPYFLLLYKKYRHTRYYDEVLNECGYFSTYVAGK